MIDKSKLYRTRDGREVRIYATDGEPDWPIHGAIKEGDKWFLNKWDVSGKWMETRTVSDLIEVKSRIKREVWVNVYPNGTSSFVTKQSADANAMDHRIACVRLTIDCEEGEGL